VHHAADNGEEGPADHQAESGREDWYGIEKIQKRLLF